MVLIAQYYVDKASHLPPLFISVPAKPVYKVDTGLGTIKIEFLHLTKFPATIEGGQPDEYEVVYELKSKLKNNLCPTGNLTSRNSDFLITPFTV